MAQDLAQETDRCLDAQGNQVIDRSAVAQATQETEIGTSQIWGAWNLSWTTASKRKDILPCVFSLYVLWLHLFPLDSALSSLTSKTQSSYILYTDFVWDHQYGKEKQFVVCN